MLSKKNQMIEEAISKGYKVIDGIVLNPEGEEIATHLDKSGYMHCSLGNRPNRLSISVHRLVAYQKFGDIIFKPGIQVRHLDNDKLNNLDYNIGYGTQSQNMMDIPKKKRIEMARKQSTKYDVNEIKDFYSQCNSYIQTMRKFNITSKGTLWYILNKRS